MQRADERARRHIQCSVYNAFAAARTANSTFRTWRCIYVCYVVYNIFGILVSQRDRETGSRAALLEIAALHQDSICRDACTICKGNINAILFQVQMDGVGRVICAGHPTSFFLSFATSRVLPSFLGSPRYLRFRRTPTYRHTDIYVCIQGKGSERRDRRGLHA